MVCEKLKEKDSNATKIILPMLTSQTSVTLRRVRRALINIKASVRRLFIGFLILIFDIIRISYLNKQLNYCICNLIWQQLDSCHET